MIPITKRKPRIEYIVRTTDEEGWGLRYVCKSAREAKKIVNQQLVARRPYDLEIIVYTGLDNKNRQTIDEGDQTKDCPILDVFEAYERNN